MGLECDNNWNGCLNWCSSWYGRVMETVVDSKSAGYWSEFSSWSREVNYCGGRYKTIILLVCIQVSDRRVNREIQIRWPASFFAVNAKWYTSVNKVIHTDRMWLMKFLYICHFWLSHVSIILKCRRCLRTQSTTFKEDPECTTFQRK